MEILQHHLATWPRPRIEAAIRRRAQIAYLGDGVVLARVLGRHKMFLRTADRGFACHVMLDGYWEMWLTQCLARYLKAGMTVVDVGANFGYYTLLCGDAVGENGRVIAVEPNPDTVDLLRETVNLNGLSSRTTIVPNALGSKAGRVLFYVPDSEPKNATIVQRTGHPGGQTIEVSAVTLDEAAKSAGKVDVVKIDAEGGEIGVIAGMKELIARDRPTIFLEFNAARYSNPRAFLDTLLASYGSVRELTLEGKLQAADISAVTDRELIMDRLLVFEETAK